MLEVKVGGLVRKEEFSAGSPESDDTLQKIREVFDIEGTIQGVAIEGEYKYAVYFYENPTISPVDFTNIETYPDVVIDPIKSLKFDLSDNSVRGKVYYLGNIFNKLLDKNVIGTGVYVGEDDFTVYYQTDSLTDKIKNATELARRGAAGVTFYADGTVSEPSIYAQAL